MGIGMYDHVLNPDTPPPPPPLLLYARYYLLTSLDIRKKNHSQAQRVAKAQEEANQFKFAEKSFTLEDEDVLINKDYVKRYPNFAKMYADITRDELNDETPVEGELPEDGEVC